MQALIQLQSRFVPLPMEDVDTDQIIPARFLKATTRAGFGQNLFRDWRYHNDDPQQLRADFPLNQAQYSGQILVAGKNFGCGSSREHAAWALLDHGFRVVVSSFFADIFQNNALNNGVLPITVSPETLEAIFSLGPQDELLVDVAAQTLSLVSTGLTVDFALNPYKKTCLLNGFDDIDYLISKKEAIASYEMEKQ